jgi:hypothetical protein
MEIVGKEYEVGSGPFCNAKETDCLPCIKIIKF